MIHIEPTDKKTIKGFSDFMKQMIGKNLKSETARLFSRYYRIPILEGNLPKFKEIMKQYGNKCFRIFKNGDNDHLVTVKYLVQFFENDEESRKKAMNLISEVEEIKEGFRTSMERLSDKDIEIFKEDIVEDIKYSYFIMDRMYEEDARNIVKHVASIDIEVFHVDAVNEKFEIDGLIYFKIPSWYIPEKNNVYNILCFFVDSRINHCIYSDRDGEIQLDKLDIRTKKSDGRISRVKFRNDLKQVFDSSWEANIARILNYLKIPYEVEKAFFSVEDANFSQSYLPDFFLENNIIIEVKGFWDLASLKKVSLFKELHKDYKLLIIDSDMYVALTNMYQKLINNWEDEIAVIPKEKVYVVGINRSERRKTNSFLKVKDEVILQRDFKNSYDNNAIKALTQEGEQIGFIRKDWASIYADKLDMGMRYKASISKIESSAITLDLERINKEDYIVYDFLKTSK